MELTILGSGGCMVIPKPCCTCRVCEQARQKGVPYERTGPSLFIHDIRLLIDTPAEIAIQLNRSQIPQIDYLIFTHLDPDHVEGFRVAEQITLDFRTWESYPEKQICLILPEYLHHRLKNIRSQYGSMIDYYIQQKYLKHLVFHNRISISDIDMTAIPIDRGSQTAFIYVFEQEGVQGSLAKKIVYAPCDIKPFPVENPILWDADLLLIQPGIFEDGLKHDFVYPQDHISRTTLYTFGQTLNLAKEIRAKKTVFVHLEEYWNRSYDDYLALEKEYDNIRFAFDGLRLIV